MDITYVIESARATTETLAAGGAEITNTLGAYIGAGIALGGAGLGVGLGQGFASGKLAEGVARNPEMKGKIQSSAIVGMAISESAVIYALVIAIILIFVAK